MARPSSFTQEIADEICRRLTLGETLRAICRDDGMPSRETVARWYTSADPFFAEFRGQYARAREEQAHNLVDEIVEISDDGTNDWMERRSESEKGAGISTGWVLNGEHVQRSRLRVDSRKWFASKVLPKIYGDKVQAELTGANGGPLEFRWAQVDEATPDPSEPSLSHTDQEASGSASTKAKPDTES